MSRSKYTRREFIRNSVATSAGLMVGLPMMGKMTSLSFANGKSTNLPGGLLPISIMEDACLLVFRTGKLTGLAEFALQSDLHTRPANPGNKGRLLAALTPKDERLIELIKVVRDDPETKFNIQKVAICFGWVCKNAAYNQLAGLYEGKPAIEQAEIQLYHDAALLRQFSSEDASLNSGEINQLLQTIQPRALTRVHTLKPADDGPQWVNRVSAWRRDNTAYLARLAETMVQPNSKKQNQYVTKPGLYNKNDDLIRYARTLQACKDVSPDVIPVAVKGAKKQSLYARAVAESMENIMVVAQTIDGKENLNSLKSKLIG